VRSFFCSNVWQVAEDDYGWAEAGEIDALAVAYVGYADPIKDVFEASGNHWSPAPRATIDRVLDHVDGFDADREPMLVDRLGPWYVLLARMVSSFPIRVLPRARRVLAASSASSGM